MVSKENCPSKAIFSYGIILLEMIARKKPTNNMFVGELTLKQWINASLPNKLMEVVVLWMTVY
jgi:LRR receptor-like serine/threonine-protein kinase FLS2